MYRLQRLAVFSFCCIFPWLCTSFFEFLHSYLWIVAIVPKQLEVYLRSTGLGLEVFPFTSFTASELHALCWSLWFIWILNRVWGRDVVFSICRYPAFPNIFHRRGCLSSNVSLLFLCQKWDGCICVCLYLDPLFNSVDLHGYFVLVPRCFCYYTSVVYLKSSMAILLALFFLNSFDYSEAFPFAYEFYFFLIIWRKTLEFWWEFYWICTFLLTV